jgi:hypothetical protein
MSALEISEDDYPEMAAVEAIECGEAWVIVARLQSWDIDALTKLFSGYAIGSVSRHASVVGCPASQALRGAVGKIPPRIRREGDAEPCVKGTASPCE